MKSLLDLLDGFAERRARAAARRVSRRSALIGIGRMLVGGAFVLPVLPFDRAGRARAAEPPAGAAHVPTDTECEYWRYCSIDGFLCSCCGGTMSSCPPGTSASKVSWVGSCHNPADGRDYLVSYNDCCGRTSCGRCQCNTNVGERPGYRMGKHNDINWCMANDSSAYHCSTSVIVGVVEPGS